MLILGLELHFQLLEAQLWLDSDKLTIDQDIITKAMLVISYGTSSLEEDQEQTNSLKELAKYKQQAEQMVHN